MESSCFLDSLFHLVRLCARVCVRACVRACVDACVVLCTGLDVHLIQGLSSQRLLYVWFLLFVCKIHAYICTVRYVAGCIHTNHLHGVTSGAPIFSGVSSLLQCYSVHSVAIAIAFCWWQMAYVCPAQGCPARTWLIMNRKALLLLILMKIIMTTNVVMCACRTRPSCWFTSALDIVETG